MNIGKINNTNFAGYQITPSAKKQLNAAVNYSENPAQSKRYMIALEKTFAESENFDLSIDDKIDDKKHLFRKGLNVNFVFKDGKNSFRAINTMSAKHYVENQMDIARSFVDEASFVNSGEASDKFNNSLIHNLNYLL